jgi:uncharacterized protein YkwD
MVSIAENPTYNCPTCACEGVSCRGSDEVHIAMKFRRYAAALGILIPGAIASAALPSNDEQEFLEITNRMRLNPQAELRILTNINFGPPATWGSPSSSEFYTAYHIDSFQTDANILLTEWSALVPAPALAWNTKLHDAALYHANQVIAHGHDQSPQQHQFDGEPSLGQRFTNAGYDYITGAENLYAFAYNAFHTEAAYAIDFGPGPGGMLLDRGHRVDMMNPAYRETGVSILSENDPTTSIGPLINNMDFGARSGDAFLTGVVYNDTTSPDHFYTLGEGIGAITIQVFKAGTSNLRFSTTTWDSGGYVQQLPAGTYDVKLSGPGLPSAIVYSGVVMGTNNVKIDTQTNWLPPGGENWTSAANWNAGVPNGIGTRAFLTSYLGSGGTISVNSPITVGALDFDSAGAFTLSGSGSVKLDVSAGAARINVVGFNHAINTPVIVNDDTAINISGGLALTGGLQNPLGKTITRAGSGTLSIAGPQAHAAGSMLAITSGTVRLQSDAGAAASAGSAATANLGIDINGINAKLLLEADQELRNLTIAQVGLGTQSIDLAGHALHIYSPALAAAKTSLWAAVRNAAASPLDGIFDSTVASHINARVGLAIVPDAHGDSHLLIRPTRIGDLNLDGNVTIADFIDLASNFNVIGTATWQEGDVNADGNVTIADFIDLASNFNTSYSGQVFPISAADQQTLASFAASVGVAVPEPASLSMLAAGALLLLSRRGRR